MIVRWWCESLLRLEPALAEGAVLRAVQAALDLPPPPDEHRQRLADYGMPRPDESHPITPDALTRKLNQAIRQVRHASTASRTSTATARPPNLAESWKRSWRARRRAAGSSATAT